MAVDRWVALAKPPVDLLVCFAVEEEMKFFAPHRSGGDVPLATTFQVWLTGIGRKNAAENCARPSPACSPNGSSRPDSRGD